MSIPASRSQKSAGARILEAPSCCPPHGVFCDEAWAAIADKLNLSPRPKCKSPAVLWGDKRDREIVRTLGISFHTCKPTARLHEKLGMQKPRWIGHADRGRLPRLAN